MRVRVTDTKFGRLTSGLVMPPQMVQAIGRTGAAQKNSLDPGSEENLRAHPRRCDSCLRGRFERQ